MPDVHIGPTSSGTTETTSQPPGPPALHSPAPLHIHKDSPAINLLAICVFVSGCNRCGEGKGSGVPRGSSSQDRVLSCSVATPQTTIMARTYAHPPDSQAPDSHTDPLPSWGRACSISVPASFLPRSQRGDTHPRRHYTCPGARPFPLPPDGAAPSHQAAKVAAKKLKVNLILDSAVGEGAPPQPQACTLNHAGAGGPIGPFHTPVNTSFMFFRGRKLNG